MQLRRAVNQQFAPAEPTEDGLMTGPLGTVVGGDDAAAPAPVLTGAVGEADVVALVDRARDGDPDAFASLYDRYVERVYRFVLYRVHGDSALAEDVTSEVFLRALRKIKGFTWH